ncbi:MAG: glucosaminidase domain-containing protein [Ktedonobacteraceae bacterium]|nr:glucosaminidase domain-containing protein [Ktedonobacteraceae bacterium]
MISSAQALSTRRSRTLPYTTPRLSPRLIIVAGSICFLLLIVAVVTHLGTYSVTPARFVARADVQSIGIAKLQTTVATSQLRPTTINASKALKRIDQTSVDQYANQQEYNSWWPSACSTASMTAVFNSYGHNYRITDILKVESGIGAITPNQGLLDPEGIDQTASKFGFNTQNLNNPTLDQMVTIANSGKPVIISFPPPVLGGHWEGGHLLIALGGTTINGVKYVHLADSSRLNMQYMAVGDSTTPRTFLYYWQGFAKILTPSVPAKPPARSTSSSNASYSVIGKPTVSADFINRVFASYNSPAARKGQALYDLGVQYGIDPAFALAFFLHESSFGTAGEATKTLSLGNLRCYDGATCVDQDRGGYAAYSSWEEGFQAWYELIRNYYIAQRGLTTVDMIIPVYAPTADHNDEAAYIASLKHALDTWHSGQVAVQ